MNAQTRSGVSSFSADSADMAKYRENFERQLGPERHRALQARKPPPIHKP